MKAARAVVVVVNGFEYSEVGKPNSPLDGALMTHRDVNLRHMGTGLRNRRGCGRNLRRRWALFHGHVSRLGH